MENKLVKLLAQLLLQRPKTGEIDYKATRIQLRCGKPQGETAAVPMHEAAVAGMTPLPMAAGGILELFAAGETRRGVRHDWQKGEVGQNAAGGSRQKPRTDAAPQPRLHRPTPF